MKPSVYQKLIHNRNICLRVVLLCIFLLALSACQTTTTAPVDSNVSAPAAAEPVSQNPVNENPTQGNGSQETLQSESPVEKPKETSSEPSGSEPSNDPKPPMSDEEIQAIYQENPHASTFIVDETGQNNTCARCHAPVNWTPSMDDIPESCLTCKFEIKDPPSYIAEDQWEHIPCKVCHEEGKKGKMNPEIAWLEIAQIGEYAAVASSTEICMKCHSPIELPEHSMIQLGSAHADYTCTQCHDPHSAQASCGASGCHDQVLDVSLGIAGHDADHTNIDCFACHDASGLDVGPDPETGVWTVLEYKSHQIELAAPCSKCHFEGNSWGLSVVE